jgi:uncharacterized protein
MFGFSIQKLLVLAAVIGAVWYGFKFLSRLDQARKADGAGGKGSGGKGSGGLAGAFRDLTGRGGSGGEGAGEAEDMVECTVCGAFVAARGPVSCGRSDCPY